MSYIERHLYDAGGHTGNTYYIRIIRRADSKIWNPNTNILEAVGEITWAESYTILEEEGLTGVFPIVIPMDRRSVEDIALELYDKSFVDLTAAEKTAVGTAHQDRVNLPDGTYDVIVYKVLTSGGDPANADDVEKQYEFKHGGIFGF